MLIRLPKEEAAAAVRPVDFVLDGDPSVDDWPGAIVSAAERGNWAADKR